MKKILLVLTLCSTALLSFAQENETYPVKGRVSASADGQPLVGASVIIKGSTTGVVTDKDGGFTLELPGGENVLTVSFIGFTSRDISISVPVTDLVQVNLEEDIFALGEVQVVSTGYQQLPRERATGSFVQIDNDLLNRSVSTGVIERLEGVVSGLSIQPTTLGPELRIRGRSTLYAEDQPLVILDNFPYDGDIQNINPNNVESITVLKDAAAASIWGARAGNGVIVITTKQGAYNQGPQVSLNSNITFGEQRDAFYLPRMSTSDFIDTEIALFNNGYYTGDETASDNRALSPVVELLIAGRDGGLPAGEVNSRINALRQYDNRRDINKYLYRSTVNQQYALSLQGGTTVHRYFFSLGYDKNRGTVVGDGSKRITLKARNNWSFLNNRLQVSGDLHFIHSAHDRAGINPANLTMTGYSILPPYMRLAGDTGEPLAISRDYRVGFIDDAEEDGLLDWRFRPLEENQLIENTTRALDYRANFGIGYQLLPGLTASLRYQYWRSQSEDRVHYPIESYYARDLVNSFTQVDEDGELSYPIPVGGILDMGFDNTYSHNFRGQLNFSRTWNRHEISALAGYEARERVAKNQRTRDYGYNEETSVSAPVDFINRFYQYYYPTRRYAIENKSFHQLFTDRFISWYGNASYTYNNRYIFTASGRMDQSNLFGVDANQRGVPLWSAGAGWFLNEEDFYHWKWLPYLKLTATYGHSGNIDKSISAYTTASYTGYSINTGLLYADITNPPNPELRWERISMFNIGLDFSLKDDRLYGSLSYYRKKGRDLIGYAAVAPTSGQTEFRGNVATLSGYGTDIELNSRNIVAPFQWNTALLFSHSQTEVGPYSDDQIPNFLLRYGDRGVYPVEGNAPLSLYSYAWAGLDPETGNPLGYLNGEISDDYRQIQDQASPDSLIYHGSARPTIFGSLRNTFNWKGFSFSFNIAYRLGYYFRRKSIVYGDELGLRFPHGDFALRWRQPGDEASTQVPSIPEEGDNYRDDFYTYSSALVEKGDHIRLRDITLSYTFSREDLPILPFNGIEIYLYARNLGILWKASDKVPDPDYLWTNAPRSYAMGLRIDL